VTTNFCSFVFTEAGRRLLAEDGLSLAKFGWQLAELHEDRRDVAVRFYDQEDRQTVQVHKSYEDRLREAERVHDELVTRLSTSEGRAGVIADRRVGLRKAESQTREREEAQTRRMQALLDDLSAWKAPAVLEPLRASLLEDARNWEPAAGFSEPRWARRDDDLVAHCLEEAGRCLRVAREDLVKERAKVERLNEWLAAMRNTFGLEPEDYWKR